MGKSLYAIYGASGAGRGILPLLAAQLTGLEDAEVVFIDDGQAAQVVNGRRCLDWAAFLAEPAEHKSVSIAIANAAIRRKLADRCISAGVGFSSVLAMQSVIMDDVEYGPGLLLSPFCTLTSNIRIGQHFHCNIGSYVEHDCVIGDFVTFAPGVRCNGNIVIEDDAYIGSGAVIRQGKPGAPLTIGKGATVGAGAIVLEDVPAGATVVGNPARILRR